MGRVAESTVTKGQVVESLATTGRGFASVETGCPETVCPTMKCLAVCLVAMGLVMYVAAARPVTECSGATASMESQKAAPRRAEGVEQHGSEKDRWGAWGDKMAQRPYVEKVAKGGKGEDLAKVADPDKEAELFVDPVIMVKFGKNGNKITIQYELVFIELSCC